MSKPRPILPEMPWLIKQKILDSTDFKTRWQLRKCSKPLKNLVDQTAWNIYWLGLELDVGRVLLTFQVEGGREYKIRYYQKLIRIDDNNHIERMIIDFARILKSPRTTVTHLTVSDERFPDFEFTRAQDMTFMNYFFREMSKLQHQVNVKYLRIELELNQHEQLRILSYFNPRTIELLGLKALKSEQEMDRVIASEQWKSADRLVLENFSRIPMSCLMRISSIEMNSVEYTAEHLATIVQEISTSATFKRLSLVEAKLAPDFMPYLINNFEWLDRNTYLVSFPDKSFDLKISFIDDDIKFCKVCEVCKPETVN